MIHELPLFDITARKHGGNEFSQSANLRTDKSEAMRQIIEFMKLAKETYSHEIVTHTGIPLQTVSARMSELKRDKVIEPVFDENGKHKSEFGCGVWRLRK